MRHGPPCPPGCPFFILFVIRPCILDSMLCLKPRNAVFFNVKLMIFILRGVRRARWEAVSEGLGGPYWPSQATSKPPLDLQKIVTNLILFAHQAQNGPCWRSKGTHKCLGIRFQAKTQNVHPCLRKTHIFGGRCTSFFSLVLHFRVQTCIKNCIRGLPVPSGGQPCRRKNHTKTRAGRPPGASGRSVA